MDREGSDRTPRQYLYAEVLRLPKGTRSPDLYTLLGLKYFEPDHGTIVRAAMERIALLETCQADPRPAYASAAEKLAARVREAQLILLDPKRRKRYDQSLIGKDGEAEKEDPKQIETDLPTGTMVGGRYRVLGERRRGLFGIVYDALDSNLRTRVELSVLRPALSKDKRGARRRSERAARAAALLDHPAIVRVDEVGDAEGLLFVRTRAVEGMSLLEVIESTEKMRLEPDLARTIGRQIADALAYAHMKETTHGDLRAHNVVLGPEDRVFVGDFCISRVVLDEIKAPAPRSRAYEGEDEPPADVFSLGCILYQMLGGMPPFAGEGKKKRAPRPLPDDVPEDLRTLVMQLLDKDPAKRPNARAVSERLTPKTVVRRMPLLIGAAGVLAAIVLGALLFFTGGGDGGGSVRERAWELIAERRFDEAIEALQEARALDPDDLTLVRPLTEALERKAGVVEKNDLALAQRLLEEAEALDPSEERAATLERIRGEALRRLERVEVRIDPITSQPMVEIDTGPAERVEIADQDVKIVDGKARLAFELPDGEHTIGYALIDGAGNRFDGEVTTVIDTKPPVLEIVEPKDGALFRRGDVRVSVKVRDANPPEEVRIRARPVDLVEGAGSDIFSLGDGEHEIEVAVVDRAGLETKASVKVVVDSKAPELTLDAERIVTPDGRAVIRGRTRGAKVTVRGETVEVSDEGAFEHAVDMRRDGILSVEATGVTGLRKRLSVRVVIDRDKPRLSVGFERRDRDGILLYGAKEIDAGGVRLRLLAEDKTEVAIQPRHGRMEGRHWIVPAQRGRHTATLKATDEAGNVATLNVRLEGHRASPRLDVKTGLPDYTNENEAVLDVTSDTDLFVQGEPRAPGRLKVPLEDGSQRLVVVARDRYGNETRWEKTVVVDRVPPKVTLHGGTERGVGGQQLRFDADEDLVSLKCFGKTVELQGRRAVLDVDLKPGTRRVTVRARDRAGNTSDTKFTLRIVNKVLQLPGNAALRVGVPANLANSRRLTIECWVRGAPGTARSVLRRGGGGGDGYAINWRREKGGLPYGALVVHELGFLTLPVKKAWRWEKWTHVAICFDETKARFFVNGSQHYQVSAEATRRISKSPLLIGCGTSSRNRYGYFFHGAIDELRLSSVSRYSRSFSPRRYLAADEHTVLLLRFDKKTGDKFTDSSRNKLHATALGRPTLKEENR
jgi:hypothetical protein